MRSMSKSRKSKVEMPNTERKKPKAVPNAQDHSAIDIPHSEIENKRKNPIDHLEITNNSKKSEIEHPTSEIKTMEVHHHPQLEHKPKPWKEYFLEFLMIFLAVTMGFFAETIRENISEGGKAKDLAKSLYKEVYADSINMQYRLSLRMEKESQMNYFRKYVKDSSLVNLSPRFYPSFFWTFTVSSAIQFTPNDGILNLLRNSGSLRYFKSIGIQNSISRMNVMILNLRNRNSQEDAFIEGFIRPFMQKYYDFDWEDELTQYGKVSGLQAIFKSPTFSGVRQHPVRNLRSFDRGDAEALATNYMLLCRITKLLFYDPYIKANHDLLQELRKAYDLKDG
jgi:hypothetical protein